MRVFGFGFGAGRHTHPRGAAPVVPLAAPGHLAAVSTAPAAAYGAQRLAGFYAGPLFQLRRAADGAKLDVLPRLGGDYPDYAAITAWLGASSATVATLYDQTGNGRHLTQATVANQPSFDPAQTFGNVVPILFDGYGRGNGPQTQIAKYVSLGGLSGLDGTALSFFQAIAPQVSLNATSFFQGESDPAGTEVYSYRSGTTAAFPQQLQERLNGSTQTGSTAASLGGGAPKTSLTVTGFASGTANWRHFQNGTDFLFSRSRTSAPIPRITIGKDVNGGVAYNAMNRLFGIALYPAQLSQADGQAVVASLNTAFAIPAAPAYRLVFEGDSIMEGSGESLLMNMPGWLRMVQSQPFEAYNLAVHGQTMALDYSQRTQRYAAAYSAARTSVVFIQAGTNDLGAGTTGSSLYSTDAAPLVSYLKGLGYKVVICTLLPRADTAFTTAMQTERTNYNSLVLANTAGAHFVLDLTQNPVMGSPTAPNDTMLFVDKLHPTSLGYRWLAGAPSGSFAGPFTYYSALRQVLGVAP